MEKSEQEIQIPIRGLRAICGFETMVYAFKDTFICKACYYET